MPRSTRTTRHESTSELIAREATSSLEGKSILDNRSHRTRRCTRPGAVRWPGTDVAAFLPAPRRRARCGFWRRVYGLQPTGCGASMRVVVALGGVRYVTTVVAGESVSLRAKCGCAPVSMNPWPAV